MKSFYAEIRTKNTDTFATFHFLAKDFDQAALIIRAWIAGVHYTSTAVLELTGLSASKRRGAKVEELL